MKTYIGTTKQIYKEFVSDNQAGEYKKDKKYICEIKECTNKTEAELRRIEQNNKYWTLLRQFAEWGGIGYTEMHNRLLGEYAPFVTLANGEIMTKNLPEDYPYLNEKFIHLSPSGEVVEENGKKFMKFNVLKNSRDMTMKEFNRLLDGLINEIWGSDAPINTN